MSIQDDIPRSRINLRYRTNINGDEVQTELPFRLIILGDLSNGSSTDRQLDLDTRKLRSLDGKNLDRVMEDMHMSVDFKVDNLVDGKDEDQMELSIPIKNRQSFLPDQVAASVPKVRSLLLLRKLLLEMQSNIDNRKELRRTLSEIFSNPEARNSLRQELAVYAGYHLPAHKALAETPDGSTASLAPTA